MTLVIEMTPTDRAFQDLRYTEMSTEILLSIVISLSISRAPLRFAAVRLAHTVNMLMAHTVQRTPKLVISRLNGHDIMILSMSC